MRKILNRASRTGRALRQLSWRLRLARLGDRPDIQAGARFEYPGNIELGAHCCVGWQALLRANTQKTPGIRLGDRSHVGEFGLVNANGGHVVVGDDSWVGPHCVVYGNGGVDIGRHVMIASHCAINTVSHHHARTDIPMREQGLYCDPVRIEDDVWIGMGAVILQGVRIGRGSIIGAGAVVTRDVPPFSIATGTPARVRDSRKLEIPRGPVHPGAPANKERQSCH